MNLQVGWFRIWVCAYWCNFSKRKEYAALVVRVLESEEERSSLKYLINVLDERPVVLEHQLLQWNWMSGYYMAPLGDLMNAALPPGLKLSSRAVLLVRKIPKCCRMRVNSSDPLFLFRTSALIGSPRNSRFDEVRSISQRQEPYATCAASFGARLGGS